MPPKPKCTKEEIVRTAFEMAREKGIESVVARELGKRLGTSATPIFTHFKNMHELQVEVRKIAMKEFEEFVADALNYEPVFKWIGIQMVRFAKEEPKLFQILFMQELEEEKSFEETFIEYLGDTAEVCIGIIQKEHDLTREEAYTVFRQAWLHTFSICVLEANKICSFSSEEISEILSMEFQGTVLLLKSGEYRSITVSKRKERDIT